MKKKLFVFLCLFITQYSFGIDYKDYLKKYQKRCDSVINYFSDMPYTGKAVNSSALCKIMKKKDVPSALKMIDTLTLKPKGDMFWFYPMVALYCYSKDYLPAESKMKIRNAFKVYTPNRGDTENHWLMYYVSLYLISQEFPKDADSTWFNGRSSEDNFKDADSYLKEWMKITTTVGQGEFDSPNYADLYATSLVMLYQFSKDPIVKKRAEILLNWILADFFVDYFDGIYAGANSRIYARNIMVKRNDNMCKLGTFLLGDKPLFNKEEYFDGLIANFTIWALSDYKVPDYLLNITLDRKIPYENKETKRSRNRIRYYDEKNPKVAKYTYVTDEYAMGSIRMNQTEQILQHSWNLNWKEEKRGEMTTLFSVQPYYNDFDMSSLFPSSRKTIVPDIAGAKTDYDKEDKLVGASPAEKLFQYKSSLIGLYDLSGKDVLYKHYDLIIPRTIKDMKKHSSGWIFCQGNNVFIAIYPLKPYNTIEDSLIFRLRSTDLTNGFIIQVKGSKEISSFKEFQNKVSKIKPDLSEFETQHRVSIIDIDGNNLEFDFSGKGMINGKNDDPAAYKLFDSPFLQSELNSQKMTINFGKKRIILDNENAVIEKK